MNTPQPPTNTSFPSSLRDVEQQLIAKRRTAAAQPDDPTTPTIGLALSGGGIRSATFSLGLLQALATLKLLPRIDYLSTVSGGGYIGSFFGALFARDKLPDQPTPPAAANGNAPNRHDEVRALLTDNASKPLRWLRDNGRYLTPNGGGDAMMAMAIALRNWTSVLVVMSVFMLTLFLAVVCCELSLITFCSWLENYWKETIVISNFWWSSPWFILPAALTVLLIIPVGWAYWLSPAQKSWRWVPQLTVIVICGLSFATFFNVLPLQFIADYIVARLPSGTIEAPNLHPSPWVKTTALALGICSLVTLIVGRIYFIASGSHGGTYRKNMSATLAWLLPLAAAGIVFGIIDSLGRTLFTINAAKTTDELMWWIGGATSTLLVIFTGMQKISALVLPKSNKRRSLPIGLVTGVLAIVVISSLLVLINALAHGIGWSFKQPAATAHATFIPLPPPHQLPVMAIDGKLIVQVPHVNDEKAEKKDSSNSTSAVANKDTELGEACPLTSAIACVIGILLTLATSVVMSFVNHSSLAPVYGARLTRSYLGASNPKRQNGNNRITELVPGDDFSLLPNEQSQTASDAYAPHVRGGPIHLINVTINETLDGQSKLQNLDRKGIGMAFGPAGLSVGVNHHAQWPTNAALSDGDLPMHGITKPGHQVFPTQAISGEAMTIGRLVGISGAAFSTGIGSRTSMGLSLLCGLFNVRTGYWWRSGTHPKTWFSSIRFLLWEWMARFPGTAWDHWYLSDGGHFENLACYEMIRRRLPFIICLDNGEDPLVLCEDLGGLVRKARLDFGADIDFLTSLEFNGLLDDNQKKIIGPLEKMRPQLDKDGTVIAPATVCASLARIRYADKTMGTLLFIKPTMLDNEPEDVRYYQRSHPAFPHEPTIDQYFDEAQWESYRRLGEHVGKQLFDHTADKWFPAAMKPLPEK